MFGGGKVMPYEDLGIYPLLHRGGAQREEWKAFAERVLEPLRAYDESIKPNSCAPFASSST